MELMDWRADQQFEDRLLKTVRREGDSYILTRDDGWSMGVSITTNFKPKAGDLARYFGEGIGHPVRGVVIFPKGRTTRQASPFVVFYKTANEQKADDDRRIGEHRAEQQETAARERDANEARIAALPPEFRARIARFRAGNPEFEWEYQPYELFTCEEAIKIAATLRERGMSALDFGNLDWEEQKRLVPTLSGEHSGNTFSMAIRLAHWYLTDPSNVTREHGALVPLVGCKAYGCTHVGSK